MEIDIKKYELGQIFSEHREKGKKMLDIYKKYPELSKEYMKECESYFLDIEHPSSDVYVKTIQRSLGKTRREIKNEIDFARENEDRRNIVGLLATSVKADTEVLKELARQEQLERERPAGEMKSVIYIERNHDNKTLSESIGNN